MHEEQVGKKAGFTAWLAPDDSGESPREWDNLTTMVCFHRRYNFGDEHGYRQEDYAGWDELERAIIEREQPIVIEPLYAYIHSGVVLSTTPFADRWDSGQIGFVFIPYSRIREVAAYRPKRPAITAYHDPHMYDRAYAQQIIQDEVATYNMFLRGDVWVAIIKGPSGEEVDSLWSLYELEYARKEALEMLDAAVEAQKGGK